MNTRSQRNPLDALLSPDARLRKEAKAALRYVLDPLADAQLRRFLEELGALLQRWKPERPTSPRSSTGEGAAGRTQ